MISIKVDEEMFRNFWAKTTWWIEKNFAPGVTICLRASIWWYRSTSCRVFKYAEGSRYDDEFTEWLKVHRPEVFL